jgi:proteasome assembly chaperone (PAC2) family protein
MTVQEKLVEMYFDKLYPEIIVFYKEQVVSLYSPELYSIHKKEKEQTKQLLFLTNGLEFHWN